MLYFTAYYKREEAIYSSEKAHKTASKWNGLLVRSVARTLVRADGLRVGPSNLTYSNYIHVWRLPSIPGNNPALCRSVSNYPCLIPYCR